MNTGIIGLGFMGGVHLRTWRQIDGFNVTAVCERNPEIGNAKQGNLPGGPDKLDLDGVAIYRELDEMLDREELDAVSIALPTHLHKEVSIKCLEAGMHVLCEKPMALDMEDCRAMIEAAERARRELMIAHCIRFWPEYVWLKEALDAGTYGIVRAAEFQRLTHAPSWGEDSWFWDTAKSGGIALDLHIHDLDFALYLFGKPRGIRSKTAKLGNGATGHIQTWLDYGGDFTVSATASWLMPKSFGFRMAYTVVFEEGAAIYDGKQLKVYTGEESPFQPALGPGDGYEGEIRHFARRIRGEADPEVITPQQAAESVRLALAAVKS